MQCLECGSTSISKNSKQRGRQNYPCKDCQRQFIETYDPPSGYDDEFERECLKMYVNGMGFRGIERVKSVHHATVITWVKQIGELLPDAYDPETRVEGENTRLRHYLARLHRRTLCYSKSVEMLKHSIRLLLYYLKFGDVPVPQ